MKMSDWFLSTVSNKDVVSKTGFSNRILENPLWASSLPLVTKFIVLSQTGFWRTPCDVDKRIRLIKKKNK